MTKKERKKEISKQPIPTKEECIAFYKELTNLADAHFVPYYKMAIKALEQESIIDKIRAEIEQVSFTHNFEYGEYYGEDTREERIVNLDAVMKIIDKYKESEG